jgi:outer membrane protein TolC
MHHSFSPGRERCAQHTLSRWSALLVALMLGGCASLSPDAGFSEVAQTTRDRVAKDLAWPRTDADRTALQSRVAELLAQPLSADAAVQVALLNNRGLQASFDELGIADADRVQAATLPNPGFTFGRLRQGAGTEIDRGVHVDLARWLTLPMAQAVEARQVAQVRAAVTLQVLSLAADTRKAHTVAVAAEQTVGYLRQVQTAAEAGAELGRRQAEAGNWNRLQQAREQGFHADAAVNLARAELARVAARERLIRLLGVGGAQSQFTLPERLPDLPAAPSDLPNLEQTAMAERLDVRAATASAAHLAKQLGLTRITRFINALEFGVVRNSFSDAPTERGFEISVELPLFDWGSARVAKAEAMYMREVNRTAHTAINARSEVRTAYAGYRAHYDIARHYRDEIVPLKKRISDENLLRYNGMLIGVFELLADARSQIASVNGYVDALRDFWLAQADLDMALIGAPTTTAVPASAQAMDRAAGDH